MTSATTLLSRPPSSSRSPKHRRPVHLPAEARRASVQRSAAQRGGGGGRAHLADGAEHGHERIQVEHPVVPQDLRGAARTPAAPQSSSARSPVIIRVGAGVRPERALPGGVESVPFFPLLKSDARSLWLLHSLRRCVHPRGWWPARLSARAHTRTSAARSRPPVRQKSADRKPWRPCSGSSPSSGAAPPGSRRCAAMPPSRSRYLSPPCAHKKREEAEQASAATWCHVSMPSACAQARIVFTRCKATAERPPVLQAETHAPAAPAGWSAPRGSAPGGPSWA